MTRPTPYAAMAGVVTVGPYVAMAGVVREGTHAVRHSVVLCRMLCVVQMTVVRRGEFAIELNSCFMLMSIFPRNYCFTGSNGKTACCPTGNTCI